jgi:signal transduction histidine kinase
MKGRIERIGGRFNLESSPQAGTRITLEASVK